MDIKSIKQMEKQYHESLYENLSLLTMVYPTTKEFDAVFNRSMFAKNNKAAFHHVVYYLLHSYNPKLTKEKITYWPLYDIRAESQFRNEVMKYINELNCTHEDAGIPILMTSHLINPGGLNFVKFMFKLSRFVLQSHLKESGMFPDMLLILKPLKNQDHTKKLIEQQKLITSDINDEYLTNVEELDATINNYKIEAECIYEEMSRLNRTLPELREQLKKYESQMLHFTDIPNYEEQIKELQTKLEEISVCKELYKHGKELVEYVTSEDSSLNFNVQGCKIPSEISHIISPNATTFSLIKLLEGFILLMEKRSLDIKTVSSKDVAENADSVSYMNKALSEILKQFDSLKAEYEALLTDVKTFDENGSNVKSVPIINIVQCDFSLDSTLATPLQDSGVQ